MEEVKERQEFFINAGGQEDNDELLDELDELEAEMAGEDLDIEIGAGAVRNEGSGQKNVAPIGRQEAKQDEEDLLAQMMA